MASYRPNGVLDQTKKKKKIPKLEDVVKRDSDNEKGSRNDQMRTTADGEKLDETSKKTALPAIEGETQAAGLSSSEGTVLLAPPKTIIQFKHNSMGLSDEAHEKLEQFVEFSSANPVSEIIVEGYSDSLGHPVYNKNLSKMRAEVVKKYLVNRGVPATKIEVVGMGPENPIASNETFEGRKLNRRIEISVKVE